MLSAIQLDVNDVYRKHATIVLVITRIIVKFIIYNPHYYIVEKIFFFKARLKMQK